LLNCRTAASPLAFGVGGSTVRSMPNSQRAARTEASNERVGRSLHVASTFLAAGLLLGACGGPSGSTASNSPLTNETPSDIRGLPSTLSAVACASSSDCWAVGTYKTGTSTRTLIEHNSGNDWTIVSSPRVGPADSLGAVTCVSAQDCWAVGAYVTDTGGMEPLIERNTGKGWTVVGSPKPVGGRQRALSSVSCADANDCWAVGTAGIEGFTGGSWRIVSSGTPDAVSCAGPSDCWAVSDAGIEQYTGRGWSMVTIPNVGHLGLLLGVTCASLNECWAVGSTGAGAGSRALILASSGSDWKVVGNSDESLGFSILGAVTCTSIGDCWAVGQHAQTAVGQTLVPQTLIEHYAGGGWTVVNSPNVGSHDNILYGVACASAKDCWAVGAYANTSGSQTLIEHYDGTSWSA
jgi:hypothetical protein